MSISSVGRDFRRRCSACVERYLKPPVMRFAAISIILLTLLNLWIACQTSQGGRTIYGSWLGGDYSVFYIAGTVLNEYSPDQLYDFRLQSKLLHSLLPGIPASDELPFLNPPFFALLFKPLALLPYLPSYLLWISISTGLYISGLLLILKTLHAIPDHVRSLVLLLAISFEPFIMETAFGGNSSAVGFFALALAIYFEHTGRFTLSGISLAICLYKPTFLLLILPMLMVSRRTKIIAGFLFGAAVLTGISLISIGKQSSLTYLSILSGASVKSLSPEGVFRTFKYTDIFSFSRLLFGSFKLFYWASIIMTALAALPPLIHLWWRTAHHNHNCKDLVYACTLTWTTVFNVHFGIYDTVIVVLALLLTANVLYQSSDKHNTALSPGFRAMATLLYVTPWIAQHVAVALRTQLFTLVLAATGAYQLFLAQRNNAGLPGLPLKTVETTEVPG